ncbi:hypothetical protein D3C80_1997030 [compost metagenome]
MVATVELGGMPATTGEATPPVLADVIVGLDLVTGETSDDDGLVDHVESDVIPHTGNLLEAAGNLPDLGPHPLLFQLNVFL